MDYAGIAMTTHIDDDRRRFLLAVSLLLGGVGVGAASIPFVVSWLPSAAAEAAGAPVEVDISSLQPGELMTVEWRGKPVWIVHRTQTMLDRLADHNARLRDPDSEVDQQPAYAKNIYRSLKPEYLVLVGICTHLGCSPRYKPDLGSVGPRWEGGFLCPCHGSTFDLSGRVYVDVPAPINLLVPPYYYKSDHLLVIGSNEGESTA